MHDIRWIREHADAFDRALKRRGLPGEGQPVISDRLLSIDERRRTNIRVSESFKASRNEASKRIGQAKAKKDETTAQKLMTDVAEYKTSIANLERELKELDEELNNALLEIPNLPLGEVPDGIDETGNIEHHHFGAKRNYAFTPKQHFELGETLGQMDFETAAKLSGSRFVVLKGGLARMERAIGQFMLDVHVNDHGYTEVNPPLLVRDDAMVGTAQLPKFEDDQFFVPRPIGLDQAAIDELRLCCDELDQRRARRDKLQEELDAGAVDKNPHSLRLDIKALNVQIRRIEGRIRRLQCPDRFGLIPTAEVPLTNLVRESIVDEDKLPMRVTALTPCFRAEAGAAGKDTRGMIRQHQFSKVELVSITTPEQSKDEHERMLSCAEEVLRRLDLHYRVVTLCTGDMGFASQKTYDIEVWLPGQGAYREISSCSNCGEFQARRMQARYRTKDRAVRHVHTLNGSGVAVGRALIAVMEAYQQEDGSIAVPDVLQPYMGGVKAVTPL
jgi:seryl-tRNA synthetase